MKELIKKFTFRSFIISFCLLALGIIILFQNNSVLFWVIKIFGVILIIDAVFRFIQFIKLNPDEKTISFDIIRAVIEAVIGIFSLVNSISMVTFLYIFIGVIVVIEGILHLQFVLARKNHLKFWIINFIIAVINILCGVFIIAHPLLIDKAVNTIIGIEIIITSLLSLCSYIHLFLKTKKIYKMIDIEYEDI